MENDKLKKRIDYLEKLIGRIKFVVINERFPSKRLKEGIDKYDQ